MNLKISSLIGAFAVATTVVSNVSPAEAVQLSLNSTLNIGGNVDITGIGASGSFNFLDFELNDDPGLFAVVGRTGDFVAITDVPPVPTVGEIADLPPFPTPNSPIDAFLAASGFEFDLSNITLESVIASDGLGGSTASIGVRGTFVDPNGGADGLDFTATTGIGTFSADFPDLSPEELTAILTGGGTIEDVSYSARFVVVQDVPEPSATLSLITLGVVGGMFGLRNRKQFTA